MNNSVTLNLAPLYKTTNINPNLYKPFKVEGKKLICNGAQCAITNKQIADLRNRCLKTSALPMPHVLVLSQKDNQAPRLCDGMEYTMRKLSMMDEKSQDKSEAAEKVHYFVLTHFDDEYRSITPEEAKCYLEASDSKSSKKADVQESLLLSSGVDLGEKFQWFLHRFSDALYDQKLVPIFLELYKNYTANNSKQRQNARCYWQARRGMTDRDVAYPIYFKEVARDRVKQIAAIMATIAQILTENCGIKSNQLCARAALQIATRLDPKEHIYHSRLGFIYAVLGDGMAAEVELMLAHSLAPDNTAILTLLVDFCKNMNSMEEVKSIAGKLEKICQDTLKKDPFNIFAYYCLAKLSHIQGKSRLALNFIEEGFAIDQVNSHLHELYDIIERETKTSISTKIENGQSVDDMIAEGFARAQDNDDKTAVTWINAAYDKEPEKVMKALIKRGYDYLEMANYETAGKWLNMAYDKQPDNNAVIEALGMLAAMVGS